jgi:hypothetical protein
MRYYYTFEEMFDRRRKGASEKCVNSGKLYLRKGRNGEYILKMYSTDIVTAYPDGRMQFSTGGWDTVTTRANIEKYGGLSMWTKRGRASVFPTYFTRCHMHYGAGPRVGVVPGVTPPFHISGFPFFDGIMFNAQGDILNCITDEYEVVDKGIGRKATSMLAKFREDVKVMHTLINGAMQPIQRGVWDRSRYYATDAVVARILAGEEMLADELLGLSYEAVREVLMHQLGAYSMVRLDLLQGGV